MKASRQFVFVRNHLLKLMSSYWFIYLIFVPLGILFGRSFREVYEHNALYGVIDFLGLAHFFKTPTMNATWWFMSAIILLYAIFPLLMKIANWSSEFLICCSVGLMILPYISAVPFIGKYFVWLPPFVIGMLCAKHNALERIAFHCDSLVKCVAFSGMSVMVLAFHRWFFAGNSTVYDALFGLTIILFAYLLLSRITFVNIVLEHLGKQSGAIFMFHTFIFSLYFKDFIYWFKYPPIIFLALTVICYIVAVGLEYLKKLIRYDKLVVLLTK